MMIRKCLGRPLNLRLLASRCAPRGLSTRNKNYSNKSKNIVLQSATGRTVAAAWHPSREVDIVQLSAGDSGDQRPRAMLETEAQGGDLIPALTPAIQEYWSLKQQFPDFLLFYQIGDFFELYFQDAVRGATLMDIHLTRRLTKDKERIDMCGIPVHALDNYLHRLIKKGIMVAICEQTGDPEEAKRARKRVKREITRLITPGTLTEDKWLDAKSANFLAAVFAQSNQDAPQVYGMCWIDLSTGEFFVSQSDRKNITSDILRMKPSEILIPDDAENLRDLLGENVHLKSRAEFNPQSALSILQTLKFDSQNQPWKSFSKQEMAAVSAVLKHILLTQRGKLPQLSAPKKLAAGSFMFIDSSARKSLELLQSQSEDGKTSFLSIIDNTVTAGGARMLASRLSSPLLSVTEINKRLDALTFFAEEVALTERLRIILRRCGDIERALQRISLSRAGPRELCLISQTLTSADECMKELRAHRSPKSKQQLPSLVVDSVIGNLEHFGDLASLIDSAVVDDPPISVVTGNFIRQGFDKTLDNLRKLRDQGEVYLHDLELKYREMTGCSTLKLRKTRHMGYSIEVSTKDSVKLAAYRGDVLFLPAQSKKNTSTFKTAELSDIEHKFETAASEVQTAEEEIFEALCQRVLERSDAIKKAASAISTLDVSTANALLAREHSLVRPVVDNSLEFKIESGRHLSVEVLHPQRAFVDNDCMMSSDNARLLLVTGANMGGKSTFLRQNALIAIMSHMGMFVPARSARIGLVDAVFSRVGASDDITHDKSTFMVEMSETALILSQATERSFIIMDEVGRGTSTNDGLAIAWSVLEHIHDVIRARTLFATHYHELTELATALKHMRCLYVHVEQHAGQIILSHKLLPGIARRSYGIAVAKLAGLPVSVTNRAQDLLSRLER